MCTPDIWTSLQISCCSTAIILIGTVVWSICTSYLLPPIGNKCQQFCTSLVQSLYYVPDSYFRSEGIQISVFVLSGFLQEIYTRLGLSGLFFCKTEDFDQLHIIPHHNVTSLCPAENNFCDFWYVCTFHKIFPLHFRYSSLQMLHFHSILYSPLVWMEQVVLVYQSTA
jgi:hypothetical protein